MDLAPSFSFKGDRDRSISLKSQAHHFYNYVVSQAELGGHSLISRSTVLPDGSTISITSRKDENYGVRSGSVAIITTPLSSSTNPKLKAIWLPDNKSAGLPGQYLSYPTSLLYNFSSEFKKYKSTDTIPIYFGTSFWQDSSAAWFEPMCWNNGKDALVVTPILFTDLSQANYYNVSYDQTGGTLRPALNSSKTWTTPTHSVIGKLLYHKGSQYILSSSRRIQTAFPSAVSLVGDKIYVASGNVTSTGGDVGGPFGGNLRIHSLIKSLSNELYGKSIYKEYVLPPPSSLASFSSLIFSDTSPTTLYVICIDGNITPPSANYYIVVKYDLSNLDRIQYSVLGNIPYSNIYHTSCIGGLLNVAYDTGPISGLPIALYELSMSNNGTLSTSSLSYLGFEVILYANKKDNIYVGINPGTGFIRYLQVWFKGEVVYSKTLASYAAGMFYNSSDLSAYNLVGFNQAQRLKGGSTARYDNRLLVSTTRYILDPTTALTVPDVIDINTDTGEVVELPKSVTNKPTQVFVIQDKQY